MGSASPLFPHAFKTYRLVRASAPILLRNKYGQGLETSGVLTLDMLLKPLRRRRLVLLEAS
jgi:hypothetical protein